MRISLPTFPGNVDKHMLQSDYYGTVKVYLEEMAKISQVSSRCYKKIVLRTDDNNDHDGVGDYEECKGLAESAYDYLSVYLFSNYNKMDFRKVLPCKMEDEDVVRKYSLSNHAFWETCRLYATVYEAKKRTELEKTMGKKKVLERMSNDSEALQLYGNSIVEGSPHEFSQRELSQAFFLLGGIWKTAKYSGPLQRYVEGLVARMCDFFCYSCTGEELDEERMRCPIESSSLSYGGGGGGGRPPQRQYYPNLDYSVMSQIRFHHFVGDLKCYEDRRKASLEDELSKNLDHLRYDAHRAKLSAGRSESSTNMVEAVTKYDASNWLCLDILRAHSEYACERISPEQKERTSSRYVYCSFSEADRDWLKYKNPISLPSFADEFISKECRDTAYDEVVKKTSRSYQDIYAEEGDNFAGAGFYEWCVLKNTSRLFALKFDIFDGFVFDRERVKNDPEVAIQLATGKKPYIVQFFSEYRVFYQKRYFVDLDLQDGLVDKGGDESHPFGHPYPEQEQQQQRYGVRFDRARKRLEGAIYDTVLLWITIMLKDFPKSDVSKSIVETLQTKHCEIALKRAKSLRGVGGLLGTGITGLGTDAANAAAALERMGDDDECGSVAETVERQRQRMILRKEIATAENASNSIARSSRGSKGVDDTESREYFSIMQHSIERLEEEEEKNRQYRSNRRAGGTGATTTTTTTTPASSKEPENNNNDKNDETWSKSCVFDSFYFI